MAIFAGQLSYLPKQIRDLTGFDIEPPGERMSFLGCRRLDVTLKEHGQMPLTFLQKIMADLNQDFIHVPIRRARYFIGSANDGKLSFALNTHNHFQHIDLASVLSEVHTNRQILDRLKKYSFEAQRVFQQNDSVVIEAPPGTAHDAFEGLIALIKGHTLQYYGSNTMALQSVEIPKAELGRILGLEIRSSLKGL